MSQFPLYNTLMSNLLEKDLTVIQKKDLVKKIELMDTDGHELIYALIKCYYIDNNKGNCLALPYNAVLSKDKMQFNITDFPEKLRQLLYKFANLHKKKLEEDEEKISSTKFDKN